MAARSAWHDDFAGLSASSDNGSPRRPPADAGSEGAAMRAAQLVSVCEDGRSEGLGPAMCEEETGARPMELESPFEAPEGGPGFRSQIHAVVALVFGKGAGGQEEGDPDGEDEGVEEAGPNAAFQGELAMVVPPSCAGSPSSGTDPVDSLDPQLSLALARLRGVLARCRPGDPEYQKMVDTDAVKTLRHLLFNPGRVLTMRSLAEHLGVSEYKIRKARVRLPMAILMLERQHALSFMEAFVENVQLMQGSLVCFSVCARYDETPLKYKVLDSESSTALHAGGGSAAPPAGLGQAFRDAAPHKVLQTEVVVVLLVRVAGCYWHVAFPATTWLQGLTSTSGDCYYEALAQLELRCHHLSSQFERRQRLASTDGDGGVARAERALGKRSPEDGLLHVDCLMHRGANNRKRIMNGLLSTSVSATIRLCLCLHFSTSMGLFRADLRSVLADRLQYRVGAPPAEHRPRLQALLSLFCSGKDSASQVRRAIISTFANGPLDSEFFVHYCTGCCAGAADCLQKVQIFMVAALAGTMPAIFTQSRWTGQERSLDFIGLLEGLSRLFSRTFAKFSARFAQPGAAANHSVEALGAVPAVAALGSGEGSVAESAAEGMAPVATPSAPPDSLEGQWEQRKQEQSKHRASVLQWIEGEGPFGVVLIMRLVVQVFCAYTSKVLYMGGRQLGDRPTAFAIQRFTHMCWYGLPCGLHSLLCLPWEILRKALGSMELFRIPPLMGAARFTTNEPLGIHRCCL